MRIIPEKVEQTSSDVIRSAMSQSSIAPEEAAQNINRSKLFEVTPDAYYNLKPTLDKEAEAIERVPAQIQPETEKFIRQSEQHASLAKDDIDKLNFIEKRAKYYKQQIVEIPELNREIVELSNKKITNGGVLDKGEEEYLQDLNAQVKDISSNNFGVDNETEQFAVDVASGVGDMLRSYWENKGILAGTVGTGAVIGGVASAPIPIPGSTVAGITAGAIKGGVAGITAIGFLDGYKQMRGQVYNELSNAVDEQGNPLNIDHKKMARTAQAVGLVGGITSGIAGKVFASNNPYFKRFLSPKVAAKYLSKSPALMAKLDILGGITENIFAEGGSEAVTEFAKIIGTNFTKMDDSEASFMNALDQSLSKENLKQIGYSGLVGAGVGGTFSAATSLPGYKGLKDRYSEVQKITQRKQEVLSSQNNMLEIVNDVKSTKMSELAPQEMGNFLQNIFLDENVWFHLEDLKETANSPEKGAAIRKKIDPNGQLTKMAQELNAPLPIKKSDVVEIALEFPEITDVMRVDPDGENPKEVRTEAQTFADKLSQAEQKRDQILSTLGVDGDPTPEVQAALKEAMEPVKDSKYFKNSDEYLDSVSFVEKEGVLTKAEAETFNSAHLDARLAIADALKQEVDSDFENIENRIFRDVNEKDIKNEIVKLENEYKIIDRFTEKDDKSEAALANISYHKRKGFSASAIDPRSLPEDLKEIYLNHPMLQKRKVFVKGGINIQESAALNGVDSPGELLRILADTPTKTEVKNNRVQRELELKNRINQTVKPTRLIERDKAFTDLTKIHVKEMEYFKTKEWPTLKRGIIKIASKVPTVESLNARAKSIVSKMKVGEISPKQFETGERRSQKMALDNYLKGEFEQAFANKEKAALNNELRKESINAKEKIAKFQNFWKNVKSESVQQSLKDAGYLKAMEDFMSSYRLDGSTRGLVEQNSFNKFIQREIEAGNYTPTVPDRLDNTQVSSKNLTVEQYQTITEMGQYLVHQAKLKNKLLRAAEERTELRTAETIAQAIEEKTTENINYDLKKTERKDLRNMSASEVWKAGVGTSLSAVASIKTIVSQLDQYKFNGYFHRLIGKPIKDARTAKRNEIYNIESNDKALIEKFYGVEKFKKMFNEFVEIPEFADISNLGLDDGKGSIRKTDLLVLQAYLGDPDGREAMTKYVRRDGTNLDAEQVQIVLDRVLESNDVKFVQEFLVNRFKQFEQRSFDLHKKTTGIEPEMIKGETFVHRGKEYPGGYYPIKRQMTSDDVKAENFLQSIKEKTVDAAGDEGHFYAKMRSAEMTQQGRLKERTGSQRPLDIRLENVFDFTEEAVHDLNFREVGIDILKVLKNPLNVKNMKAVVGPQKFVALLNGVKDVVSKTTEKESVLFADENNLINRGIQTAHTLHAVSAIGFNLGSAAMQADSLTNVILRQGAKSGLYIASTAKRIATNLSQYDQFVKLAEEINPDIKFEKDSVDNSIIKESYDFIPGSNTFFKNYKNSSSQSMARIREFQKKGIDASFYLVRQSDRLNKVIATLAISEQFLNGEVDGYPPERLEKMSESEKASTLRSVVQQTIDLTLTASAPEDKTALEKNKIASIFVRYWTDRRSQLNSVLAQIDKAKGHVKRGDNTKAATSMLTLALATGIGAAFVSLVRNDEESILKKLDKVKDEDDIANFAIDTAWHFIKSPIDKTLGTVPGVDLVKYQAELDIRSDYRNVSTPLFGVMSNVSMGVVAMKDMLSMAVKGKSADLSDVQRKALLTNAGYIVGGAPTNAMWKGMEALQSRTARKVERAITDEIKDLHKEINSFIDVYKDDPEAQLFIEDLKEYQQTLPQFDNDVKNIIPENTQEVIKQLSSKGKWDAYDSDTGAAGIYQFTEERWNEISTLNPDLGLTENGRVSKSPEQQEKAMNWVIQDNTRGLMTYEIPVTQENLLGAHKFGFDNFVKIYNADSDSKLNKVLGEDADNALFKNFKTVKSIKSYLSKQVNDTK